MGTGKRRHCLALGLSAVLVMAGGCASTLPVQAEPLPAWVGVPPQDNAIAFFGVGEGPTLNEATRQALGAIAGKLSTRIRSDAVSTSGLFGNNAIRSYQETVEAYIQDIKLSSYNVSQTELVAGRYFVLVEMSREEFIRDTRLQLETAEADLRRRLDPKLTARPFQRFLGCQAAPALIEKARLLTLVLSTADSLFEAGPYLQRYEAYQHDCDQAMQDLTLHVKTSPAFEPLAEALGQALDVRTVTAGRGDGSLEIQGTVSNQEMFGNLNAMIDLSVALLDDRNSVVARKSYRLNGMSMISHDSALQDALRKFLAAGGADRILADLGLR